MQKSLIDSILLVSKLVSEATKPSISSSSKQSNTFAPQLIEASLESLRITSLAVASQLRQLSEPKEVGIQLFEKLQVGRDEEVHSNAIAACFQDSDPIIGCALLYFVLKETDIDIARPVVAPLIVTRERALGSLSNAREIPPETRSRRIDILIEHPEIIVAIENKIDSQESINQTQDYYVALAAAYGKRRQIYGIFLSPDKRAPDCANFRALSYADLYQALSATMDDCKTGRMGFLRMYTKEIFDIFVNKQQRAYFQSIDFWKGKAS
jgi:hypothetical protein